MHLVSNQFNSETCALGELIGFHPHAVNQSSSSYLFHNEHRTVPLPSMVLLVGRYIHKPSLATSQHSVDWGVRILLIS